MNLADEFEMQLRSEEPWIDGRLHIADRVLAPSTWRERLAAWLLLGR